MTEINKKAHWANVYENKQSTEVSWFEQTPDVSLGLISELKPRKSASIIDVGGGASSLVDCLLNQGYSNISVLDISEEALSVVKERLGERQSNVHWIVSNICEWLPKPGSIDIWHDRATFHFMTTEADRDAYISRMKSALPKGGHAIIGTFALDGPEKCSGLPIVRYEPKSLQSVLGNEFSLVEFVKHTHTTPWGSHQSFQFSVFKRA